MAGLSSLLNENGAKDLHSMPVYGDEQDGGIDFFADENPFTAEDPDPIEADTRPLKRTRSASPAHAPPPAAGTSSVQPAQQQSQQRGTRRKPLEPSLFLVEPMDEFVREVADWIKVFGLGVENLEIEAKIGRLVDANTRERISLPVPTEAILMSDEGVRFESTMTITQHKHYNTLLNTRVEETAPSSYPFSRISYTHTREIDEFHQHPSGHKIRVSKDAKSGEIKACVAKTKLADMNIYSPKRDFDWRISVSAEDPAPRPPENALPQRTRQKDRLSYTHELVRVDLTQVSSSNNRGQGDMSNELEIEFRDAADLMRLAQKENMGDDTEGRYFEAINVFVNNIRVLVRNPAPP